MLIMKKLSESALPEKGVPEVAQAPALAVQVVPVKPFSECIVYKNNQLIGAVKPAGIPTQPDKTGDKAFIEVAEIYCKCTLFPIHRLDRTASGLIVFAKSKQAANAMSEQFRGRTVKKTYLAIVGVRPAKDEDTLVHFIKKNEKKNVSTVCAEGTKGAERAELHYKLIGESDRYFLLEIDLLTGRHHQIRAQLSAIGSPIKGDVKYGFRRSNGDRSIHLHAWKLSFDHPVSGERVNLEAEPPPEALWDFFMEGLNGNKS